MIFQDVIPSLQVVESEVWIVSMSCLLPPRRNLWLKSAALHLLQLLLLHQLVHATVLLDFVAHLP